MDAIVMNGLRGEEAIACYTERRCNGRIFSFSLLLALVGVVTNKPLTLLNRTNNMAVLLVIIPTKAEIGNARGSLR